jgi:hypothetical protein
MQIDQVQELIESGKTDSEIGAILGVSRVAVQRFRSKYGIRASDATNQWSRPDRNMTMPLSDGTTRIIPIQPGKPSLRVDLEQLRYDLAKEISGIVKGWKPALPPRASRDGALLHVIAPVDLHVGKLAWKDETGEDFDSSIAKQRLTLAIDTLLARASRFKVSEQLLVVGNDLLQVDNLLSTTTLGTFQDTDSRYRKMFRLAVRMMTDTVRRMLAVAPVKVIVVPGNHDVLASFHVGEVLTEIFREVKAVTICDSLLPRIYHEHGQNLLGFCHGNEERHGDLPLVMAQEASEAWSRTTYREFLVGHLHKRRQTEYISGDSFNGVKVTILPSLTGTDAWHARKGYIGEPKASESMLYDSEDGCIARFTATMKV